MTNIETALARVRAFADSWAEHDLIDEESGLTRADLELLSKAADDGMKLARATLGSAKSGARSGAAPRVSLATLIASLEELARGHGAGTPVEIGAAEWVDGAVRFRPAPVRD